MNAGLLTLAESISVIMGANIGTTVTAWIISIFGFKVDTAAFALPLLAIALPLIFSGKSNRKSVGETLEAGEVFGTIEVVKTISDLFLPVAGEVIKLNEALEENPELVNNCLLYTSTVVPILAPMMTLIDSARVSNPAFTKLTTCLLYTSHYLTGQLRRNHNCLCQNSLI